MNLKILMIPFSILMVLVLGIGFINPDYTAVGEKKALVAAKTLEQANIQKLAENTGVLTTALETEKEAEDFLQYYVPKDTDQDRVIDMLNFLAAQSGVATDVIGIETVEEDAAAAEAEAAALAAATDPSLDPSGTGVAMLPPYKVKTRAFSASVTVKGEYESIKDFLGRVAHMNRLHKTRSFSLKSEEKEGESETNTILVGQFQADFDYLVPQATSSALNIPVFSQGSFSTGSLKFLSDWVTNRVPVLEKPDTGRPNPFQ